VSTTSWPVPRPARAGPPTALSGPPHGAQAGWYPDPHGYPLLRFYDGRAWTATTTGVLTARRNTEDHPVLDLRVAVGAVVVLIGSLIASRFLLEYLVEFEWPIVVFVAISMISGYGPSVVWCAYASRRWGTGHFVADVGLRFHWSDTGWGPIVWLAVLGCQLSMALVIYLTGIPLASNTEGIAELDLDRTYVISLLVATVIAAPFVEETVFRGLMLRGLRSRMGAVAAITVQGVLFGAAHIDPVRGTGNIGLALILSAVGVGLGGAAYLLRRLGPTIVAHAIFNGVVMTVVLTT